MKNILLVAGLLTSLSSLSAFAQPSPNLTLKIIPGATTARYQDQVEFKAYLYNKTKEPIRICNPNHGEPAWRVYTDEWLVIDGTGKPRDTRFGYDGADHKFGEKDITIIPPGDSLYVRYFKYKFDADGKFTVKYTLNHDPSRSYYKDTKAGKSLTVFKLESNTLTYDIKQSAMAEIKTAKLLPADDVYKEKTYTSLDDAFGNAEKCYRLKVAGIKQEDFNKVCKLKNLRTLELSGAKIDSIPAAFGDLRLIHLFIDLENSTETPLVFPATLGKMNELTNFGIRGGAIKLPEEFSNLTELKDFGTTYCSYESLPANFGNLKKLTSLNIYYNMRLKSLPASFSNLTSLQFVTIGSCQNITQFPAICNSPGIINLSLSDCPITSIPPEIGNLKKMNFFGVESAKLKSLPPQLLELPALRQVSVRKNEIPKNDDVAKAMQKKLGKLFFF